MNILIITREFPPQDGGIAVLAYEMARHFSLSGKQVWVMTWQRRKELFSFQDEAQPFKVIRLKQPRRRWLQIVTLVWHTFRVIRRYRIQRVFATTWNFSGVPGVFLSKVLRVPFAVLTHGYDISRGALSETDQRLMKTTLKQADKVFAASHFTVQKIREIEPYLSSINVIPHGVDSTRFRPDVNIEAFKKKHGLGGKKVLLTLARLFPRKGHDKVLEALPKIVEKVPDVFYLIAGEGEERENLQTYVKRNQLNPYVGFSGFIPNEDLAACYAACDVFILPNREITDPQDAWAGDFEGFGISFVEASACGKPIIVGKSGGAVDTVTDGETGILVDPVNVNEIADAAILLLTNESLAKKMGAAGRARVEKEFSWTPIIRRYEAAFEH